MKNSLQLAAVLGLMCALGASGQVQTTTTNYTIGLSIPDNNLS